jgi:predicted N-acyltransferase
LAGLRAKRKIVRIGNGDMIMAKQIVQMLNLQYCSSFEIEFVDEKNTSVKIKNFNQRGKRDRLSAKFISQREGFRHFILPLSLTG